jgi:hypothetical protein
VYATDNDTGAGLALSRQLVDLLRADGMFEPSLERYAGEDKISRLRDAFDRLGLVLDRTGALRPKVIDNFEGIALTEALQTLVSRIDLNLDDTALQVGSGKELDGAAARHVLKERLGDYPVSGVQVASRSRWRRRSTFSASRSLQICSVSSARTPPRGAAMSFPAGCGCEPTEERCRDGTWPTGRPSPDRSALARRGSISRAHDGARSGLTCGGALSAVPRVVHGEVTRVGHLAPVHTIAGAPREVDLAVVRVRRSTPMRGVHSRRRIHYGCVGSQRTEDFCRAARYRAG